jgi:hypothetical protein
MPRRLVSGLSRWRRKTRVGQQLCIGEGSQKGNQVALLHLSKGDAQASIRLAQKRVEGARGTHTVGVVRQHVG